MTDTYNTDQIDRRRILRTTGALVAWVAANCCLTSPASAQPTPNHSFRIAQLPGDPVPLPTDGFSVRQINGLWHDGTYYVYADVIGWGQSGSSGQLRLFYRSLLVAGRAQVEIPRPGCKRWRTRDLGLWGSRHAGGSQVQGQVLHRLFRPGQEERTGCATSGPGGIRQSPGPIRENSQPQNPRPQPPQPDLPRGRPCGQASLLR